MNEPNKALAIGPWKLLVDADKTRRCYERMDEAPPEGCGCDPCKNFGLIRESAYPPQIITFFEELGIDRRKPFELSHYSRMPSGRHLYGGWHYVCGSIESGPACEKPTIHRISPTFEIGLTSVEHPRQPFPEFASIQIDFYTEVPWMLNAPEPE